MSLRKSLVAAAAAVGLICTIAFAAEVTTPAKEAAKPAPAVKAAKPAVTAAAKSAVKPSAKPAAKPAAKPTKAPIDVLAPAGPEAVVCVVNGDKITKKQLYEVLWGLQSAAQAVDRVMINYVLINQKAKKAGVTVTDKDVANKLKEFEKRPDLQGKPITDALAEMGVSKAVWIEYAVKPNLLVEKIIAKEVKVTDADVAQFIHARHILVSVPYAQEAEEQKKNDETAKAEIDKIAAEVKGGLDFAAAADQYSKDPGNSDPQTGAKKGGDLGWFKREHMIKEFSDAAFALKPGDISEPVKTYRGWHLIKLEKLGKDVSAAEKQEIKAKLSTEKTGELTRKFYQDLRTGAKIDNRLVKKVPPPKPPVAGPPTPPPPPRPAVTPAPRPPAPAPEPAKTAPAEAKPAESAPAEAKPAEPAKPAEAAPAAETKPAEAAPAPAPAPTPAQ